MHLLINLSMLELKLIHDNFNQNSVNFIQENAFYTCDTGRKLAANVSRPRVN